MTTDAAVVKAGNWVANVITCTCGNCQGTWDLGICDYEHPSRLRMWHWRFIGKPRAARRITKWNHHAATLNALEGS